jgi:hypothetical protein
MQKVLRLVPSHVLINVAIFGGSDLCHRRLQNLVKMGERISRVSSLTGYTLKLFLFLVLLGHQDWLGKLVRIIWRLPLESRGCGLFEFDLLILDRWRHLLLLLSADSRLVLAPFLCCTPLRTTTFLFLFHNHPLHVLRVPEYRPFQYLAIRWVKSYEASLICGFKHSLWWISIMGWEEETVTCLHEPGWLLWQLMVALLFLQIIEATTTTNSTIGRSEIWDGLWVHINSAEATLGQWVRLPFSYLSLQEFAIILLDYITLNNVRVLVDRWQ